MNGKCMGYPTSNLYRAVQRHSLLTGVVSRHLYGDSPRKTQPPISRPILCGLPCSSLVVNGGGNAGAKEANADDAVLKPGNDRGDQLIVFRRPRGLLLYRGTVCHLTNAND